MKAFLILSILFVWSGIPDNTIGAHDFHLSKCKIKYRTETKSWEISAHIFIDDLQEALKLKGVDISSVFEENESEIVEQAIYYYLLENVQVELNGQLLEAEWIGKELSEDLYAVWVYLEIPNQELFGALKIDNNILLELFDDQTNITVVELPNQKKKFLTFQEDDEPKIIEYK